MTVEKFRGEGTEWVKNNWLCIVNLIPHKRVVIDSTKELCQKEVSSGQQKFQKNYFFFKS